MSKLKFGIEASQAVAENFKIFFDRLVRGYRSVTGRDPEGLDLLKIQLEAGEKARDSAKVISMTDRTTINPSKGIIGGQQIKDSPEFGQKIRETYDAAKGPGKGQEMVDALKSPGAQSTKSIMEDNLGMKLYGDETFEEILQIQKTGVHPRGTPKTEISSESLKEELMKTKNPFSDLVEETKKGPKTIEQRRKEAEEALRNKNVIPFKDPDKKADGGRAGFANGSEDSGAPSIVLNPEERAMDKEFETSDVKEAIKEIIKRSIGPLDMAEIPLTEKGNLRFGFDSSGSRQLTGGLDLLGGELNIGMGSGKQGKGMGFEFRKRFDEGGMSRRQFMKIMGGIATLPVLGKYIKPAMPLIQKGAEITGPALDKIVQTVMSAGKLISQSGRRVKEMVTKKKLKDVEVEEDIMDGPSYTIKTKDKTIYYRPGRQDEMGIDDDIIEVIEDTVTKKAGGGIARMLGE